MPVDLLIESDRITEPDHKLLTTAASWRCFRELWIPGIRDLRLISLEDLDVLGDLDVTIENKSVVIEDLLKLKSWIESRPPLPPRYKSIWQAPRPRVDDSTRWSFACIANRLFNPALPAPESVVEDLTTLRIARVAELLEEYVDDQCRMANIS